MKKLITLLFMIFLLCGCSKSGTLSCKREFTNEDNFLVKDTMEIEYESNIVTKVVETNITENDEDMTDLIISYGNDFAKGLNNIAGFNLKYEKENAEAVKYTMTIDYKKLDIPALKEQFGDDFDEDLYASNKINIKGFRENNLEDYTCK